MAVCAQASFSQRATWPPSATVRQRSMALITFNWSRLTCLRLASRQAGPWSRKISAPSRVGRPTSAALTPPVRAYASSLAAGACRQAARADSRWRRSDLWPHVCSAPSCPAWNAQAEPVSAGYRIGGEGHRLGGRIRLRLLGHGRAGVAGGGLGDRRSWP